MGKTALERLSGDEGQLFHLVTGHLSMLALWIFAAACPELIQRALGPLSWSAYVLLNLVSFVALLFLVVIKCEKSISKLIDLAERYIETPRRLQIGYVWIRRKIRAIESFVSAFLVAFIATAFAGGHVPELGLEEMENFARSTIMWITIYGLFLALLILASWFGGLLVGRRRGT